jgi:hypothetical protein
VSLIDASRLKYQLQNTGLQNKDNPLWQLLYQMLGVLEALNKEVGGLVIDNTSGGGNTVINLLGFATLGDDGGGGSSESGPPGPAGAAGANGTDGANGMVPYFIATTETFTIPLFKQALFSMNIDNEGILDIEGFLIEVD